MRGVSRRGYTLIEMLIVVAMLSLLAAASMMMFTAPAVEVARSSAAAQRMHANLLLARLMTADLHGAVAVSAVSETSVSITLLSGESVLYGADGDKIVRREAGTTSSAQVLQYGRVVDSLVVRPHEKVRGVVVVTVAAAEALSAKAASPGAALPPQEFAFTAALAPALNQEKLP